MIITFLLHWPNDFGPNSFGPNDFWQNVFWQNDFGPNSFGQNVFWPNDFWPNDFWPIYVVPNFEKKILLLLYSFINIQMLVSCYLHCR
jgi:hypothetical protein